MIRSLREMPQQSAAYDVCVIGAGAAGILLSLELHSKGKRVVLLESGAMQENAFASGLKEMECVGRPHGGIMDGRYRVLGGATTRWGGQIAEFDAHDFEPREGVPGSGWPFPKQELQRYYERVFSGVFLDPRKKQDADVWRALQVSPPESEDLRLYFTRWLKTPNFAVLYADRLAAPEGPDVVLDATALEIDTGPNGRATQVHCAGKEGHRNSFRAHSFVLALGTMETSRFLLQNGAEGRPRPWSNSRWIGKHYADHVAALIGLVHPLDRKRLNALFENAYLKGWKYHPKMKLAAHIQRQQKILNVGGTLNFITPSDTLDGFDILKSAASSLKKRRLPSAEVRAHLSTPSGIAGSARSAYRLLVKHRASHAPDTAIFLGVECEQEPLSASSITLSDERDALGVRKAKLDWRIGDLELKTVRVFAEVAARTLAAWGIGKVEIDSDLLKVPEKFLPKLHDTCHHMGGTRMASSSAEGVVDPDLKVFGTENLFLLSGSVFPTSSYSNPTCTLLALAYRLADHLR